MRALEQSHISYAVDFAPSDFAEGGTAGLQDLDGRNSQTIRGVDVGMQLKMPLSERVAMELRGGKYYWKSRTHGSSVWGGEYLATRRGSDTFVGAGMEVSVFEEFTATLGWTRYEIAGEPIALWTIGTRIALACSRSARPKLPPRPRSCASGV